MELAGKVIEVLPARSGVAKSSGNPWMLQEYVIETHEQYPKKMVFSVFGEDKIKQFNIQQGEEINVFFDINARDWTRQDGTRAWSNDIRAWRIDRVTPGQVPAPGYAQQPTTTAPAAPAAPVAPTAPAAPAEESTDDLPF